MYHIVLLKTCFNVIHRKLIVIHRIARRGTALLAKTNKAGNDNGKTVEKPIFLFKNEAK